VLDVRRGKVFKHFRGLQFLRLHGLGLALVFGGLVLQEIGEYVDALGIQVSCCGGCLLAQDDFLELRVQKVRAQTHIDRKPASFDNVRIVSRLLGVEMRAWYLDLAGASIRLDQRQTRTVGHKARCFNIRE